MKKTKFMTRVVAVVFALAVLFAMSVPAWAAGTPLGSNGKVSTGSVTETEKEVVRIKKELTAYNPETSNVTVNEPSIEYTYSIAKGSKEKSVTDSNGVWVYTKEGVTNGVTMTSQTKSTAAATTTVTFDPTLDTQLLASSTGTYNEKWIDIDFSSVVFGAAGVYRYEIKETQDYTNTGVVEGSTNHTRYLDVYVRQSTDFTNNGENEDDWDVYGFTLFNADSEIVSETENIKTTGFVAYNGGDSDLTADSYNTFNVTISKSVVNDNVKKNNQFPFDITFANNEVTKNVLPILSVTGNATVPSYPKNGTVNGIAGYHFNDSVTIADSGTATITGIPTGTVVTVKEKNNVEGTTYQVTTSTTGATIQEVNSQVTYNGYSGDAVVVMNTANSTDAAENNVTIAFTNTFKEISPTGLAFRIAPYVLMLAAGVSLIVLFAKRKHEATDII